VNRAGAPTLVSPELIIILVLAVLFGLYMAWGIGANDVANAMGTSVGSGALTLKKAVIFAAVLEFAGAFFAGSSVSQTVRKGIVDLEMFQGDGMSFMLGMLSALLAAGVWLQIASFKGWPVSTTHSIVGSIVGFGAVYGGMAAVHWDKVGTIVASWVVSPLLSGTISFLIFHIILRTIFYKKRPLRAAKKITPYLVFLVFFILTLTMVFKGLKNLKLDLTFANAMLMAVSIGVIAALISAVLVRRIKEDQTPEEEANGNPAQAEYLQRCLDKAARNLQRVQTATTGHAGMELSGLVDEVHRLKLETKKKYEFHTDSAELKKVERLFVYLQILSACMVAFAHGANDVANSIGPMSAVISVAREGGETIAAKADVPLWILAVGGIGIVIGLATWGWRVMETIGKKITHLTPTRGFSAEFGAATTVVIASKMGLPISTTHTLVGAVLGVGLARGISALNLTMVRNIFVSWIVTIPAGAFLAIVFFYILRFFFV